MLQYMSLDFRNKKSYDQFKELLLGIKKWLKPYQAAMKIRQDYPASQYKLPKDHSRGGSLYKVQEFFNG
jgi:hypothetical protein